MAHPLRIGAGVIGIIVPSRPRIRLLLDGFTAIIYAPMALETITNIQAQWGWP